MVQGLLMRLAEVSGLKSKIDAMAAGAHINITEDRAVMHIALRAARDQSYIVDGKNVVPDVYAVLDAIKEFSDKVRSGEWKVRRLDGASGMIAEFCREVVFAPPLQGCTGKAITNVISVGIGGSYLGPEFVYEALRKGTPRLTAA